MTTDARSIALAYIDACGRGDIDAVAALLHPDLEFVGPARSVTGSRPYLDVLRRLGAVWSGSEVRKVFTEGDDVCVIYDFVTNTPAGRIPTVEWLRIDGGRITSVTLFFDRVSFKPAADELARRTAG